METPPRDSAGGEAIPLRVRVVRTVARLLMIVVCTYVGVSLLISMFQTRFIYFPARRPSPTPADRGMPFEDLTLTTSDGVSIAAWYVPFAAPKGTILFCHGNAGNISDVLVTIGTLHSLGYNVLVFDYRGFGRSDGKPSEKGTYRDAEAAWRYLTQTRGEPPERIVVIGRSLGGAVAIHLAAALEDRGPAALVVESSFTTLADVGRLHNPFLPVDWLLVHRYDSISKVGRVRCPKLFLHGTGDRLIPIDIGRRLFEAASEPKSFIETPGGHSAAGFTFSTRYVERLAAFLDEAIGTAR